MEKRRRTSISRSHVILGCFRATDQRLSSQRRTNRCKRGPTLIDGTRNLDIASGSTFLLMTNHVIILQAGTHSLAIVGTIVSDGIQGLHQLAISDRNNHNSGGERLMPQNGRIFQRWRFLGSINRSIQLRNLCYTCVFDRFEPLRCRSSDCTAFGRLQGSQDIITLHNN